jgi:acetylornithine deacetylase/succinyl-diaminopimelate desuccinylase-like protein
MTTTLAPWGSRTEPVFDRLAPTRARLAAHDDRLIATQVALCEIPSPTGAESERGASIAARFRRIGLCDVHVDEVGNVLGTRAGTEVDDAIVVCAHLDSVFPADTPLEVVREGVHLSGPGIVDNARGLAVMLALAESIDGVRLRTRRPILFAATVGEEGCGDLRGVKHLFDTMHARPAACIAIDGAGDERIVTRALGSRRLRVTFRGPGGHSWASFGIANPVHAAGAATARLASMPLPRFPRTTLSVCRVGGGISINAIPGDAWIEVDIRSSSADVIARCASDVELAVRASLREENARRSPGTQPLDIAIEVIGDRPCGELDQRHALVECAVEATMAIGRVADLATASTDANVPISLGIPAIAIGAGGRGGNVHTRAEWFDNTDGQLGVARALTLLASVAELE